jgi:putative transposase
MDHRAGASARCRRSPAKRGADAQVLGRSRGGLSTKIHAAGDALGNPVRLIGSPGQRNDIAFAHQLVEGFAAGVTIADKGYDADHLCDRIAQTGGQSVIPAQTKLDVQTFLRRRALPRTPLIVWTTTFTLFLLYD